MFRSLRSRKSRLRRPGGLCGFFLFYCMVYSYIFPRIDQVSCIMPPGWVHQTIDRIVFGRIYRAVHQGKDAESQRTPGLRHRYTGHDYYWQFLHDWDFRDPFPDSLKESVRSLNKRLGAEIAEKQMASDSHDYLDRIWDDLPEDGRVSCERFLAWLIYNHQILKNWAGVDGINGRILRSIEGQMVWEESPETVDDYKRLKRYVSKNHIHRLGAIFPNITDYPSDFPNNPPSIIAQIPIPTMNHTSAPAFGPYSPLPGGRTIRGRIAAILCSFGLGIFPVSARIFRKTA